MFKKTELGQLEKKTCISWWKREGEAVSLVENSVIHNAENIGLVLILDFNSEKESTLDQELANCNKMFDIAAYIRWQLFVTIKKCNLIKDSYIQIRLYAANVKETYINYSFSKDKELSQDLGDFMFVQNCKVH